MSKTTKQCTMCNLTKQLSYYNKHKRTPDGLRRECRECSALLKYNSYRTKGGVVSTIYNSQTSNSILRGHTPPSYSKKEFKEWIYSQDEFHILYDNWKRLDYQKRYKPSVDRKNDYIGYTMSNIQLMTWGENWDRGHADRKNGINNKANRSIHQCTEEDELIFTYYSINEAVRQTGIQRENISQCCRGIRSHAGGFVWRYVRDA